MFAIFIVGLITVYALGYAGFIAYDWFMLSRQATESQEVVIDITPSLVEYVPMDAEQVVKKEQEQNRLDLSEEDGDTEEGNRKNSSMNKKGENDRSEKDIEDYERNDIYDDEEMMFEQLSEGDDDDYTPLNASEEYDPLEFKKMLQDSYQSENLFYEVFHSDVKYESMDDDENYKEE